MRLKKINKIGFFDAVYNLMHDANPDKYPKIF